MFYNKGIDIPYQELPLTGQFNVLPLDGFQSELARLPHRHNHYQIIWFMKAAGKHIVDFVSYELEDNVIFLLQPGQVHQLLDCNKQGHFITFTEKFYFSNKHDKETLYDFTCLFDSWQGYSPIRISDHAVKSFQSLIELMSREMSCSGCSRGVVKHYLNAFLLLLEREKKRNATQIMMPLSRDSRVVQLRRLLEVNYNKEHQVAFYANAFALTPKRLNEITKEKTGRTVTELLHDRLVLEAKRNLAFSHKSVKEICYELGFEDPAYFSRFFKNHTGISPQDYREMMFK
ncbi:helix-turn-helix domain-containing protein [Chitinophaga defluvii]|uniref:Helix-turn-helix domain-containing protein n=1 Tax=Chitinophaga defluvii TaxID=3163343 RepID=A0ABV2T8S5_9BACT